MAVKEQPVGNINAVSRISAGTVFKGEIESKSDIRIDGTFEGKISTTGRVVVGEGAYVKGEILAYLTQILEELLIFYTRHLRKRSPHYSRPDIPSRRL